MSAITVYTKPMCPQCDATKRHLARLGVEHVVVDVTVDRDGLARVREIGYAAVPVIVAGDVHWMGFRPDMLDGLTTLTVS
ncbi:MAG: NrdH-redoxin [Mycobacterium sp.]|nr:MAG: NrdH-redoxin [Mycobacterium sp.]